jgi:predicted transcriptional regulator
MRQPASVNPSHRFTRNRPCPICNGYDTAPRGKGVRCSGFLSDDEEWAYCTREEYAGRLEANQKTSPPTYAHRMRGECRCGVTHSPAGVVPVRPSGSAKSDDFDRWAFVAAYSYPDPSRVLGHQTLRYENPKAFRQRVPTVENPDPKNHGHWKWSLNGARRYLYRLPELLAADPAELVFVLEGEKDADRAAKELEVVSTTNPEGAGKWRPEEFDEWLRARHVVIVPDLDNEDRQRRTGQRHAETIARSLRSVAASVRVLALPGVPSNGGDLSDWIDAGGTREELIELVRKTPLWRPDGFFSLEELLAEDIEPLKWTVDRLIPEGLVLFAGKPKMGKSWLALDVALAVACGGFALGRIGVKQGDVLYLALEDGKRRLQDRCRRLLPNGKVPTGIAFRLDCPRIGEGGADLIAGWIDDHPQARLVVIDTLKKVRDQPKQGQGVYDAEYEALQPLAELAQRRRVAILVVYHFNKRGEAGDDRYDAISGSTGLTAVVDATLGLFRKRGQADAWLGISSRDGEEGKIALQWDAPGCVWKDMGDADEYQASRNEQRIMDILPDGPEGCTPTEVADEISMNRNTVKSILRRLSLKGLLLTKKGRYWRERDGERLVTAPLAPLAPDAISGPEPQVTPGASAPGFAPETPPQNPHGQAKNDIPGAGVQRVQKVQGDHESQISWEELPPP